MHSLCQPRKWGDLSWFWLPHFLWRSVSPLLPGQPLIIFSTSDYWSPLSPQELATLQGCSERGAQQVLPPADFCTPYLRTPSMPLTPLPLTHSGHLPWPFHVSVSLCLLDFYHVVQKGREGNGGLHYAQNEYLGLGGRGIVQIRGQDRDWESATVASTAWPEMPIPDVCTSMHASVLPFLSGSGHFLCPVYCHCKMQRGW